MSRLASGPKIQTALGISTFREIESSVETRDVFCGEFPSPQTDISEQSQERVQVCERVAYTLVTPKVPTARKQCC